ncbi:MAG: hypothetical protein ACI4LX_00060 [Treponema sp.]
MKKIVSALMMFSTLAFSIFAEKNWEVEIQAKLNAVTVEDVGGAQNTSAFLDDIFDDDTKIGFTYDGDVFEAGFEITPVFFWKDGDLEDGTPDPKNAFTALYAGVKLGSVAKLRAGIYENRTEDFIEDIKLNDYIDEMEFGFLDSDLNTNIESDLITGPFLADFYAGPVTIQLAPVSSVFYGDEKKYGGQVRVIAALDAVDVSANYRIEVEEAETKNVKNQFAVFGKLNVIEGLPILAGFSLYAESDNSDAYMYGIDLRTQKDFGFLGFSFHNNLTILKDDVVMYNGLGIEVPFAEKMAVCLELNNMIDFKEDSANGRFIATPYFKYSPVEDVALKAGIQIESKWNETTTIDFSVPVNVEVKF